MDFPSLKKLEKIGVHPKHRGQEGLYYVDHAKTIKQLKELGVPFSYSVSPSGCYAYRVARDLDHVECTILRNAHPGFAPMMLPVVFQDGSESRFPMNYVLGVPVLFKTWTRFVPKGV